MIGLANPALQYRRLKQDIDAAVLEVLASGAYTSGSHVSEFETEFAAIHGVSGCVALGSGTAALETALRALGIGPGDDVIVPANTFIAGAEAVLLTGANVVFADCETDFYGIDVESMEAVITPGTRAVIITHMFGQSADTEVVAVALEGRNITLVEDCAQAHLARSNDHMVGTTGIAGCFSFYPGKNLGACGEAGALISSDEAVLTGARRYINHGSVGRYRHDVLGNNCRMDVIQAAILRIKLKKLKADNTRRRAVAACYDERFAGIETLCSPRVRHGNQHVYHLYVLRCPHRDELRAWLETKGIAAGIHYPVPCHMQKTFTDMGWRRGQFPNAELCAETMISLPVHAELSDADVEYVGDCVTAFFTGR